MKKMNSATMGQKLMEIRLVTSRMTEVHTMAILHRRTLAPKTTLIELQLSVAIVGPKKRISVTTRKKTRRFHNTTTLFSET